MKASSSILPDDKAWQLIPNVGPLFSLKDAQFLFP